MTQPGAQPDRPADPEQPPQADETARLEQTTAPEEERAVVEQPTQPEETAPDQAAAAQDQPATPATPVAQEIPAGWYPDPEGRAQSRYWDGGAWTDQLGPLLTPAGSVQTMPSPAAAFVPVSTDADGMPVSDRSRLAAALLCFFVGVLGVHRFYVGKVGTGVLQLVTFGGLGIWALVDLILILVGSFRDAQHRLLINW